MSDKEQNIAPEDLETKAKRSVKAEQSVNSNSEASTESQPVDLKHPGDGPKNGIGRAGKISDGVQS